ncbi:MAG: hypothetical protein ACC660_07910, partial [Acidimicrobiales bacterium]
MSLFDSGRLFLYTTAESPSPVAAALARGDRAGATEVHIIVDHADPELAAMAAGLRPAPVLWLADGADPVPMQAGPLPSPKDATPSALAQITVLEAAGCEAVVEHGVVVGEVLGLEVARVAVESDGRATLRVGVGLYDQEAHALLSADAAVATRLEQVVDEVRGHRSRDAAPHPLNRLARPRWLRSTIVARPDLVELDQATNVEPLAPRGGIRESTPMAALGTSGGSRVLVVCSTGIDLDLVPTAAAHLSIDT